MIKKAVILGGVALAALVFFGSSAKSYFRTFAGGVSESVENSVPVEFQLQRARTMIKDLTPEVRKNMHTIAKEEVELQRLDEQITGAENRPGQGERASAAAEGRPAQRQDRLAVW